MADQYRKGNEDDHRQGGRGLTDRASDEVRTWFGDDDARARRNQDERQQYGSDRHQSGPGGQYSQGPHYGPQGGSNRQPGTNPYGQDQGHGYEQPGQYSGSQYGGASAPGRGYPESDFMPHRAGSSDRDSEQRDGARDYGRTSGSSGDEPQRRPGGESSWGSAGSYGRSQGAGSFGGGNQGGSYGGGHNYGSGNSGGYGQRQGPNYGTGSGPDWSSGGGYGPDSNVGARSSWGGGALGDQAQSARESYSGRGPKDYKRSDERIREDVSDRLEQDHAVDASDISVQVQDGEVTLSGTVPNREQKRRAEDCVEAVSGVREVSNNLRTNRGDTRGGQQQQAPASETSSSILGLGGQKSRESEGSSATQTAANTGFSAGKQGDTTSGRAGSGTPGSSGGSGTSA